MLIEFLVLNCSSYMIFREAFSPLLSLLFNLIFFIKNKFIHNILEHLHF